MTDILNSYLVQHKSINIPGLGTIYLETVPARNDFVNRKLWPPFQIYRFDKYFDAPDKEFFTYLATHKKIPDYDAIRWYNEFSYNLRSSIRNNDHAVWEGVGIFRQDGSGEIVFEENRLYNNILPAVTAERVIRSNASHAMVVGDRETTTTKMSELLSEETHVEKESWWIYALIIAAVCICAVFFHVYRYGLQFGSMFK
jgi:hypothetical protein